MTRNRAGVEFEKYGTTPGCPGFDAILTGGQAKSHSTKCRERIMREMQHDEKLARCFQAAEGRKRPRANPDDERDAVRPTAMQDDDDEHNPSSAGRSGDGNRDQPGPGEMHVEGQATQASVQGVKRLAEAVLQRDSDTRVRSSNEPMCQTAACGD